MACIPSRKSSRNPSRNPSYKRIDLAPLTQWITAAALRHGAQLPAHVMQRLGISRRRATLLLQRLAAAQWLVAHGPARRRIWQPGPLRQVVQRYALAGLHEDLPWRHDFAPFFELPTEVRAMAQYAFTELLNNAIDHSGGASVTVTLRQTPLHLQLLVSDDGCGVFDRIAQSFDIADPQLAMFELSKGKLTSQPARHAGHGLFYSARLADVFDLHANGQAFQFRSTGRADWRETRPGPHLGTSVYLAMALDTPRTLDSVLREHSHDGRGHAFERTQVALRLLAGDAQLPSRADARRVAARLQGFAHVELDFTGIAAVGHGFADELLRVQRAAHAGCDWQPVGMNAQVSSMLASIGA
jgi:anti-sigma regulatory factor (Ser/Thr protein kinase)